MSARVREHRKDLDRRAFLATGFRGTAAFLGASALAACNGRATAGALRLARRFPALRDPDAHGIRLPPGFTSRVVARSGERPVAASAYAWHLSPDGGAVFATEDGGWIYVSNSEVAFTGGAGALRFDARGCVVDAYPILADTSVNCAGGKTPWGTWLSCEEFPLGCVHECFPDGKTPAIRRPALGVFAHEAVATDPVRRQLYLTEDVPDGGFYRFTPHVWPDLGVGVLEVAIVDGDGPGGTVRWMKVPDPLGGVLDPTRTQVRGSTQFKGGEGVDWHRGKVFFTTKGDNRVWVLDTETARLDVLYDWKTAADPCLRGVDNVTITPDGDVLVAEDAGDMQIIAIAPTGELVPVLQVVGHPGSEIAGPAFDPSGSRLYFSSQRGTTRTPDGGVTFEITGPFAG